MKSVKSFVMEDMWGHILMSGPDVTGYITGEMYKTPEEKHKYCQGIFTAFPHMMLSNFNRWLFGEESPKDYAAFMDPSVQALQDKVFPLLDQCFDGSLTQVQRGEILIPLLTDTIPKHVLTGYYNYMFAGREDFKDIAAFWPTVEPLLSLVARTLKLAYSGEMPVPEQSELFLFVATRMPYLLIKRWYDWQFGKEKMEGPPGPPPQ